MTNLPKHHFVPNLTDPNRCVWSPDGTQPCGSYWNNYVAHFQEGDGSRRPDSWVDDLLMPPSTSDSNIEITADETGITITDTPPSSSTLDDDARDIGMIENIVQDDGYEFRIMRDLLTNDLLVIDRKQDVHATFRPWHADLAEETMDRLNVRRLAGRG